MSSQGLAFLAALLVLSSGLAGAETLELGRSVVMRAAAVAETGEGLVGATASITITAAKGGSGHVFLDTFPLTQLDMQGSARLAARVATQLTGKALSEHDLFFVIRSGSEQIGGPSAGAALTVGAIAALSDWEVRPDVLMTGTINADGTVGPVGGIPEKAAAAARTGMSRFLYPAGQELIPVGDGQVLNMTAYCRDELRIECYPVVDVVEAVGLMTDHRFERPPVTGNVTGADFRDRLGPLSQELIDRAAILADEAGAALEAVPEGPAKGSLQQRLAGAQATLERARASWGNGTYYTAASLSFQSSIESHYVRDAARYVAATDRLPVLERALADATAVVAQVRSDVEARAEPDTGTLESLGAAQVRLLEAEERLAVADGLMRNATTTADVFDALYQASYASERARTGGWWLRLSEGFPAGAPIAREGLEGMARDTITTSTEEVAYVEAVLSGAAQGGQLREPREKLAEAEKAMARGYHAAAILEALEASVRAGILLEVLGFQGAIPETKLDIARIEAARAIQGARERGVESFLAQSAYEFALSLEDPQERLAFLGLARVAGNIAGVPGLFGGTRPLESRFQGVPAVIGVSPLFVAAAFAVGLALGAGAGMTALMPRREEDEPAGAAAEEPVVLVPPPGPPQDAATRASAEAEPMLDGEGVREEGRDEPPRRE